MYCIFLSLHTNTEQCLQASPISGFQSYWSRDPNSLTCISLILCSYVHNMHVSFVLLDLTLSKNASKRLFTLYLISLLLTCDLYMYICWEFLHFRYYYEQYTIWLLDHTGIITGKCVAVFRKMWDAAWLFIVSVFFTDRTLLSFRHCLSFSKCRSHGVWMAVFYVIKQ